jgi:transcriptional regulator GlxA family with amidase domain
MTPQVSQVRPAPQRSQASRIASRIARLARRFLKGTGYALVTALPLLLALATPIAGIVVPGPLSPAPAFARPLPAPPAHDAAKPTAVILAGNAGTEVSDLLGPYEVLAASGAFNVYVIAPERRLTPLVPIPAQHCCAAVDLAPHYSFAEFDRAVGVTPDLVVVPYIPLAAEGQADAAVLAWLRDRPGEQTVVLSICGGAQMVADSGILAGHTVTSHHVTLPQVRTSHPEVTWVHGLRYVDDGRFVSSAGVTSGVDASLHVLRRFFGRAVADETARRLGYPHTRFLDDPSWTFEASNDAVALPNLFRFGRAKIGVLVYPGIGEIELSSVTDTYPRALATDVLSIGAERTFIRTRHGLDLLPRHALASAPDVDRLLIPGQPAGAVAEPAERWATSHAQQPAERIHAGGGYPYDLTFSDMARHETRLVTRNAAAWIEYPTAHLDLGTRDWSLPLVVRPVALLALGALGALGLRRLRLPQRSVRRLARAEPAAGAA